MSIDALAPPATPQVPPRHSPVALLSAAALTLGAGAVHLAVVPGHLQEYPPFGVFFVVVGLAQFAGAAALVIRPARRLFVSVAAGQAALVGLWLVARTSGLPFGPDPWVPEPAGVPDVICVVLQLATLPILLGLALRGRRQRRRRPVRTPLAVAPVVLLAAAATFVGIGTGLSGTHDGHSAAPPADDPSP